MINRVATIAAMIALSVSASSSLTANAQQQNRTDQTQSGQENKSGSGATRKDEAQQGAQQQPRSDQDKAQGEKVKESKSQARTPGPAKTTLANRDKQFVTKAASGGKLEVELGRLATERAASDDVKKFGQRMVDDHSKVNDQLMQLANTKGLTLSTELDPKHKATIDRMSKLSGADFDRAYMSEMVKDHTEDVALFERQSTQATDPEVKAFAEKTLPTLREHLQLARETASKVGATPKR
jgi:putative membrane protein